MFVSMYEMEHSLVNCLAVYCVGQTIGDPF